MINTRRRTKNPFSCTPSTSNRHGRNPSDAPGVVRDAIQDLELIRAAGIHGLEPAFQLLESALDAGPIAEERVSDNELDGGARNT